MRFRIRTLYRADVDAVAQAYADPALYEAFSGLPRADRPEVLEHRATDGTVVLHVRWRFSAPLSPAARAVVDPERLSWVEQSTHDLARHKVTFTMVPDHYRDRFSCSGSYSFDAVDEGCTRIIEGDLRIKALLVAGAVEKAIVSGLEDQLTSEAPIVEEFVTPTDGG